MINVIIEQLRAKRAKRAALAAAYQVAPTRAIRAEFADVQRALNAVYCKCHAILKRNQEA